MDTAREGTCLSELIEIAIPICKEAEQRIPRMGPGRPPQIPDWVMAVLVVVVVLKHRKSKSSQYRFLVAHRSMLVQLLGIDRFPSRTTYFDRYRRAWLLIEESICIAGEWGVRNDYVSPRCVAVDKSVVEARGPMWNKRQLARNRLPKGADQDATWTYSSHDGWRMGYSYEVVVTAEKSGPVWPLAASASPASWQPDRTFPGKIPRLPKATRYILADSGYQSNDLGDAVELEDMKRRTGRRLLCPYPSGRRGEANPKHKENSRRRDRRIRRQQRWEFFKRPFAQNLIKRRGMKVKPFNDWLKTRFDLHDQVWHRGLENNQTQLLAAIFAYQILLMFNHLCGNQNGQIQWIIDTL